MLQSGVFSANATWIVGGLLLKLFLVLGTVYEWNWSIPWNEAFIPYRSAVVTARDKCFCSSDGHLLSSFSVGWFVGRLFLQNFHFCFFLRDIQTKRWRTAAAWHSQSPFQKTCWFFEGLRIHSWSLVWIKLHMNRNCSSSHRPKGMIYDYFSLWRSIAGLKEKEHIRPTECIKCY